MRLHPGTPGDIGSLSRLAAPLATAAVALACLAPGSALARGEEWARSVGRVVCLSGGRPIGTGSGFVVDAGGRMVTNHHVVARCADIMVLFSGTEKSEAHVIAASEAMDLALLRTGTGRPALRIRAAAPEVVMPVLAIGFPGSADISQDAALQATFTPGFVEKVTKDDRGREVVQTTAEIKPGNSGGPLLDGCGRVVGVNTFLHGQTGNVSRFAVAASELRRFLRGQSVAFREDASGCAPASDAHAGGAPAPAGGGTAPGGGVAGGHATGPREEDTGAPGGWGAGGGVTVALVLAVLLGGAGLVLGLRQPRQVVVQYATRTLSRMYARPPAHANQAPIGAPAVAGPVPVHPPETVRLVGLSGPLAAREFAIGPVPVCIGRDPAVAAILLPPNTVGVGRQHLQVFGRQGMLMVRDCRSKGGTTVDGMPLQPDVWTPVRPGQVIMLGGPSVQFVVR